MCGGRTTELRELPGVSGGSHQKVLGQELCANPGASCREGPDPGHFVTSTTDSHSMDRGTAALKGGLGVPVCITGSCASSSALGLV